MTGKLSYDELEQRVKELEQTLSEADKTIKALKESQNQFQRLYERAPLGYQSLDEKGKFIEVNPAWLATLGYSREEVIGQSFSNFLHPEWREHFKDNFPRFKAIGEILGVEFEMLKKDGSYVLISFDGKIGKDINGHFQQTHCILKDITERRQMEESLREREREYRDLYDKAPVIYMEYDSEGRITRVNLKGLEKLGYTEEEMIGESIWNFVVEKEEARKIIKTKFTGDEPPSKNLVRTYIRKNGTTFPGLIEDAILNDKSGRITGIRSTILDITERKQAEEALEESEETYRMLFEHAGFSIVLIDAETFERIEFNREAHERLGYSREEFKSLMASEVEAIKPSQDIIDHHKKIIENGSDIFETKHKAKNGELRDALISIVPVKIRGKYYFHNIIADITDRKRLEDQLLQSQKMESIGTLAGGIAHDFNNILSPIMIHSEMAQMNLPPDSPLQYNLEEIYKAGVRAAELVKQILTFSRKGENTQTNMKMTPILVEVLKMLRASIPTTIKIKQNLEAESDIVFADPTQVHQILLNLGSNAAHAMRERGGVLEIGLVQEDIDLEASAQYADLKPGSYIKLIVRDNGTGIDSESLKKVFEPYFTTKMPGEGTGIGLALVHGIVKSYKGDITVESELGKGTTFNIYLPRINSPASKEKENSFQLSRGSERILFVDDEESMLDAIKPMLEILDYKVTGKTESLEALELFRDDPDKFDLIITDMTMPNMTGRELAKEIMLIRPDIPIIICTGYSDQIDKNRAKEMGISAYIMKPIVMHNMANTIREVLDRK